MEGPIFKIGDTVVIKDKYDKGMDALSYPFGFAQTMLEKYGAKLATIVRVNSVGFDYIEHKDAYNGDNYKYFIDIDGRQWEWHSSMFKNGPTIKSTSSEDLSTPWSLILNAPKIILSFL